MWTVPLPSIRPREKSLGKEPSCSYLGRWADGTSGGELLQTAGTPGPPATISLPGPETLSPPGPSASSQGAMPAPWTICSLLLLSVLCMDLAMAGSSFLSPEHQKLQRKEAKKPSGRLKPRTLEGQFDPEVGSQAEGAEDELEIRFNAPFNIGIKLAGAQSLQHGQTLGKFLQDILWEEAEGKSLPSSAQFQASPESQWEPAQE
uniref:Appetite-regulating hormone n=7 Tax=Artiodactyla TaxID=91561 RepID=A0A4W2GP22_BOBOX